MLPAEHLGLFDYLVFSNFTDIYAEDIHINLHPTFSSLVKTALAYTIFFR